MIAVVVAHGAARFDSLKDIHIRVGGLPLNPKPPLQYSLVFSVDGLINEYVEPARVIRNGELIEIPSLTEVEHLSFDAPFDRLEAFITSGGTSTLVNTYLGEVENLDYKTIRYRGHSEKIKTLSDLGFFSSGRLDIGGYELIPREFSGLILSRALSSDSEDCVLVQVELIGEVEASRMALKYRLIDYYDSETGLTAMMRTTAFPAAIVAQMLADGTITARGTVPQELAVPPEPFFNELAKRGISYEETWSAA
jgi:lysine 6-dehydrogenase